MVSPVNETELLDCVKEANYYDKQMSFRANIADGELIPGTSANKDEFKVRKKSVIFALHSGWRKKRNEIIGNRLQARSSAVRSFGLCLL